MVWYFCNTTLRSANRYPAAMKTIERHGLSGRLSTPEQHVHYAKKLLEDGVTDPKDLPRGDESSDATTQGRKFPLSLALHGFLSFSLDGWAPKDPTLRQLNDVPFSITPAGEMLMDDDREVSNAAFRHAILTYQIANPIREEDDYGYHAFKPAWYVAATLFALERSGETAEIRRLEGMTLVQLTEPNEFSPDALAAEISRMREEERKALMKHDTFVDACHAEARKRLMARRRSASRPISQTTLKDYWDTNARHLAFTGLFVRTNGRLSVAPGREAELADYVAAPPDLLNHEAYLEAMWRGPR